MATSMPHVEQKAKKVPSAPEGSPPLPSTLENVSDKISAIFLLVALIGMLAGAVKLVQLDAKFTLMLLVLVAFAVCWVTFSFYAWKRDRAVEKPQK
jgi:hypothetical protein